MSAWNSYSDPRLHHPGASPASMPGNATPSYNPGIGSPAQQLYLPSPHNNPYLGTPNPYLGTPNPHAMLSPAGASYPYPAYNPAASPYGYMSQAVPVQMVHIPMYVEEYNGDNPWELFFQLRDDNNLDPYWVDWAQTELNKGTIPAWAQREYAKGTGAGGFGASAAAEGAAGRDTLPPSIGKGPRTYRPPNTSKAAGPSGSGPRSLPPRPPGTTKAGPSSSARPRDRDRHGKPEKEKRISISDANAIPVPPKNPPPDPPNGVQGMEPPTTPATITATTIIPPGHASSSNPTSTLNTNLNSTSNSNSTPAPMISLSRMREAKAQEYTRALKENRPLNFKNVTQTTATVATNNGEDEVTVFPGSSTFDKGDGGGPTEDVDMAVPAPTFTHTPVLEAASETDASRSGAGLDSGMRLNDDEITVYRLGQRGISNEYLASILRPDPNPPTHVLSPEESWSTPAGRVKKGFYAEVVARLVKSRVEARDRQLEEKGGAAHSANNGDDDTLDGTGWGFGCGVMGSGDELKKEDDEGVSMGWDVSELWPAEECDKDLSDLVL